jgi:hypothetical protein
MFFIDDPEELSSEGRSAYDNAMEKLLTHKGCPQCMATAAAMNLKDRLMEEKKDVDRGKLMACRSILQIPHRCDGKGVTDGFRYRSSRNRKSKTSVQRG